MAEEALQHVPAEVPGRCQGSGKESDLLARVLAHVAHPQVAGGAVEAEAPRVAQAVCPDLVRDEIRGIGGAGVWVRRRDPVEGRHVDVLVHVEAEHLAPEGPPVRPRGVRAGSARRYEVPIQVLRVLALVAARAPVAEADVEVAVGTELEIGPVVVRERVVDDGHHSRRSRVGHVGVGRDLVAGTASWPARHPGGRGNVPPHWCTRRPWSSLRWIASRLTPASPPSRRGGPDRVASTAAMRMLLITLAAMG